MRTRIGRDKAKTGRGNESRTDGLILPCTTAALQRLLPRDEEHLARAPAQRPVTKPVVCPLHDQTGLRAQLCEPRWRVQPDAMLAISLALRSPPRRADGENSRQSIERSLVRDQGAVLCLPPVAGEEARHHAVAITPVPDEQPTRLEDARELGDHSRIVRRIAEKAERREEIQHGVKSSSPAGGQFAHVAPQVTESRTGSALFRAREEVRGVVETVDVESCFDEEMRVSSLPARHVEESRARRKLENLQQPRYFVPVTLEREDGLVLEQVLGVEVGRPPIGFRGQKKTGSRYAP